MLDHKSVSILDVATSLKLLAEQRIRDSAHDTTFANLTGIVKEGEHKFIGIHAAEFLYQEYQASQTLDPESICICSKAKVLGLPCRHKLKQNEINGELPLSAASIPEELRSVDYFTPPLMETLTESENHEPEDAPLANAEPEDPLSSDDELELDYDDLRTEMTQLINQAKRNRRVRREMTKFVYHMREVKVQESNSQEQEQQITSFRTPGAHSTRHSKNSPLSFAFKK
jgi:hypothetical protein